MDAALDLLVRLLWQIDVGLEQVFDSGHHPLQSPVEDLVDLRQESRQILMIEVVDTSTAMDPQQVGFGTGSERSCP